MSVSIGKISGGGYSRHVLDNDRSGAAEYYAGEDVPSQWRGAGAEQQGLSGAVDAQDFRDQMAGCITDATGERNLSEERSNRTAGYDVTIEAPKSVSIEALVHGNDAALDAHRQAVAETLLVLESGVGARVTEDGRTRFEATKSAAIASFEHHGNVNGDPHLHTHNVVANYTLGDDGKARAIDAKESIYSAVADLSKTYDAALEKALNARGIGTYRDDNGHTQIAGYSADAMREFSTRQADIREHLAASGIDPDRASAEQREYARQETRRGVEFEPRSREETQRDWQERAAQFERGAGPYRGEVATAEQQSRSEQSREQQQYTREEFREAKWCVNEGKAAEQRLADGRVWDDDHRARLEQKVESMERLRETHPDLYDRAEKAVEKMGVRDPDERVEQRVQQQIERAEQQAFAAKADIVQSAADVATRAAADSPSIAADAARAISDAAKESDLESRAKAAKEAEERAHAEREKERAEAERKIAEREQTEREGKRLEEAQKTADRMAEKDAEKQKAEEHAREFAQRGKAKDEFEIAQAARAEREKADAEREKAGPKAAGVGGEKVDAEREKTGPGADKGQAPTNDAEARISELVKSALERADRIETSVERQLRADRAAADTRDKAEIEREIIMRYGTAAEKAEYLKEEERRNQFAKLDEQEKNREREKNKEKGAQGFGHGE